MQGREDVTSYMSNVKQRLEANGFRITDNVIYKDWEFTCVAKGRRCALEYGGLMEIFFVFAEFQALDSASLTEFSSACFKYTTKSRLIPLPYVPFDSFVCFSIALVNELDPATAQTIRDKEPPRHFGSTEMPVVYEIKNRMLFYFERTPLWGALFWDHWRQMIGNMLSP